MGEFYVYEHWRPDKGVCFYVGKGVGNRAFFINRKKKNEHHSAIVRKLSNAGLAVDVRFVETEINEARAFELERERIAHWRALGVALTNKTDGGEGHSGLSPSLETRAKKAKAMLGRKLPPETIAKMRDAASKRSPEHIAKISAALAGRTLPAEHVAKLKAAKRPPITEEHRAKLREGQARRAPRSEETKAKTAASIAAWHASRKQSQED